MQKSIFVGPQSLLLLFPQQGHLGKFQDSDKLVAWKLAMVVHIYESMNFVAIQCNTTIAVDVEVNIVL